MSILFIVKVVVLVVTIIFLSIMGEKNERQRRGNLPFSLIKIRQTAAEKKKKP